MLQAHLAFSNTLAGHYPREQVLHYIPCSDHSDAHGWALVCAGHAGSRRVVKWTLLMLPHAADVLEQADEQLLAPGQALDAVW